MHSDVSILTFTDPIVVPTRSSNDLKAFELLTSPSFFARLPPSPPNSEVVFSVTPDRASDVFWYLSIKGINKSDLPASLLCQQSAQVMKGNEHERGDN